MLNSTSISRVINARFWALSFVLLNVLDLLLTLWILQAGGSELNPLIRATLQAGVPATAALKIGVSAAFAWLLYRLRREGALKLATVMIAGVCLFNAIGLIIAAPLS